MTKIRTELSTAKSHENLLAFNFQLVCVSGTILSISCCQTQADPIMVNITTVKSTTDRMDNLVLSLILSESLIRFNGICSQYDFVMASAELVIRSNLIASFQQCV